ncbi:MAG: OmpH family outer membrane protein [Gemmataceae bacterium]
MCHRLVVLLSAAFCAVVISPSAGQEAAPPTRIAAVNMGELLRNYAKAKAMKEAIEAEITPYKVLAEKLKTEMAKFQATVVDPLADMEAKNAASKNVLAHRRKMEDLDTEVRRALGAKQEQFIIDLYTDIQAAVRRHADANKIDLVVAHSEPAKDDIFKFANVTRKITATDQGGTLLLFVRDRIDITDPVLKSLNDSYAAKK